MTPSVFPARQAGGGGNATNYVYNAFGQRVEKQAGSAYTEIMYHPFGTPIGHFNRTYYTEQFVPPGGSVFANYQDGKTCFLHANHLGSGTMVTNNVGDAVGERLYYPYGQRWAWPGQWTTLEFSAFRETVAGSADLYVTPFRHYAPAQFRWLSPDPLAGSISNPQSLNRYAYVLNNPVNFVDPLVLDCSNSPINNYSPECYPGAPGAGDSWWAGNVGSAAPPGPGYGWTGISSGHGGSSGYTVNGMEAPGQVANGIMRMDAGYFTELPTGNTTSGWQAEWVNTQKCYAIEGGSLECWEVKGQWVFAPVEPPGVNGTDNSQRRFLETLIRALPPGELGSRVIVGSGMLVSGTGVAYAGGYATVLAPYLFPITVPVAAAGAAMAVEGVDLIVTGRFSILERLLPAPKSSVPRPGDD